MRYILVLFLTVFSLCCAQDAPPVLLKSQTETLVEASVPTQKRLVFIVDTSGSMDRYKVASAIQAVMDICNAPVDDFQVSAISFGTGCRRWEGTEDIDPNTGKDFTPPGWSAMPSVPNLEALNSWLWSAVDNGGTAVRPAFEEAFKLGADLEDVSFVLISDCILNDGPLTKVAVGANERPGLIQYIQRLQQDRVKNNKSKVSVGIFGISMTSEVSKEISDNLAQICDLGIYNLCFLEEVPDEGPH